MQRGDTVYPNALLFFQALPTTPLEFGCYKQSEVRKQSLYAMILIVITNLGDAFGLRAD